MRRFAIRHLALFAVLPILAACGTDDAVSVDPLPNPPRLEPIKAPETPEDAPVTNLVVLSTTALQDLDGSGLPTQLPFAAYLYAEPYPAPKWSEGSFMLSLYPEGTLESRAHPDAEPLAVWRWSASEAAAARSENLVGPYYRFRIDLTDRLPRRPPGIPGPRGYDFLVTFASSEGGQPIHSSVKRVWRQ